MLLTKSLYLTPLFLEEKSSLNARLTEENMKTVENRRKSGHERRGIVITLTEREPLDIPLPLTNKIPFRTQSTTLLNVFTIFRNYI